VVGGPGDHVDVRIEVIHPALLLDRGGVGSRRHEAELLLPVIVVRPGEDQLNLFGPVPRLIQQDLQSLATELHAPPAGRHPALSSAAIPPPRSNRSNDAASSSSLARISRNSRSKTD